MQQQQQQQCQKKQTHNKTNKNSLQTPLGSFPCPTKHSLREIVFSKLMSLSQWEITHREYISPKGVNQPTVSMAKSRHEQK